MVILVDRSLDPLQLLEQPFFALTYEEPMNMAFFGYLRIINHKERALVFSEFHAFLNLDFES